MEKFTMAQGVAVRYGVFGMGEKRVVLLHGYLESMEIWEEFSGLLGKEYRVMIMDLPGSGFSDWGSREAIELSFMGDVLADVMKKESFDSATIVGHSMGGYAALAFAKGHLEMVEKLVLLHSSPYGDTEQKRENRQREIDLILAGKKEMLAKVNPARGFAKANVKKFDEIIEGLYDQVMMSEDEAIVATLRGMMKREDNTEFFKTMDRPRLMIFGDDDNYIPREVMEKMVADFPTAQSVLIEGSGHMSFIEQSEKTLEALKGFMG